jgi:hypothetical protein
MDKFNSLSLVGFSGKIVTEVIEGGEFVLDLSFAPFSSPQHRIPMGEKRKERRIKILMRSHNLGYPFLWNKKIEKYLFFINLSKRE